MLYTLYEMQHAAFAPIRFWADQGQRFFSHPYNPVSRTPYGKVMAASLDMVELLTRRYGKPKFGFEKVTVDGVECPVEEQILSRRPFGQLKHFKRANCCHRKDPRVLVVAPMSGHFATLLRGTVEALLPNHEVYITDWRDARDIPMADGSFDLDDYVDYLVDWLTDLGPNTHVLAVCQPSVPVYAALALMEAEGHPCTPPSVTMMGGPIDTRRNPTEVNKLAMTRPHSWFEDNVITVVPLPNAGFMRKVYPGFLQLAGFMAMNLGDHFMKHHEMFEHLIIGADEDADKTRAFYDEYKAVMDMTAEFYLQTIDVVFQRHLLPDGKWVSKGRLVDPKAIKNTALMAVEGEFDDISGIGQTKAALDIAVNLPEEKKKYLLAKGVGHYGIFNGSRWRTNIAPVVADFMRTHDHVIGKSPAGSVAPAAPAAEAPAKVAKPVSRKAPSRTARPAGAKTATPKRRTKA